MAIRRGSRLYRFALGSIIALGVTAAAWLVVGPRAGVVAAVIGYLAVAWISDDQLGNCFILAVLLLIVVTVVLMAFTGAVLVNTR